MGRRLAPREFRLATGPQLYALNRAGLLELRAEPDEESPVLNGQADQAIKGSMARARSQEAESTG